LLTPADEERYPNLDRYPMTKRALLAHRAMQAGMSRDEALAHADALMADERPVRQGKPLPEPRQEENLQRSRATRSVGLPERRGGPKGTTSQARRRG
jgi:hypothetical protein